MNNPHDNGGPTNFGVTQRTYDAYRKSHNVPLKDVKKIANLEVKDIYNSGYWLPVNGDKLPNGVDYCVFDYAINSGPSRAGVTLQAVIGVAQDSVIGAQTLKTLTKRDHKQVINDICNARLAFMTRLVDWPVFGKGWSARVERVRAEALKMASNPVN